jgi:hypothetical protein
MEITADQGAAGSAPWPTDGAGGASFKINNGPETILRDDNSHLLMPVDLHPGGASVSLTLTAVRGTVQAVIEAIS